jgi:hypothetical protein
MKLFQKRIHSALLIKNSIKRLYLDRGLLEAGSVYEDKLKRIELNSSKLYTVLDKKRDEDLWGWKIYER